MRPRRKATQQEGKKRSTKGAIAANLHEGSRSELLADYLFSGWGTVTPVRRQDDFGLDLYCTLTEQIGRRAMVTDYFVVQVKSTNESWHFHDEASVRWLVEYPQPLFLSWIDKKSGIVRIYHVTPRFFVGAMPLLPNSLILKPVPNLHQIMGGILTAAEGAECIGGQLARMNDLTAALYAALFVDHLQQTYPDAF